MQDSRGPKRLECSCSPTGDPTATSPLTAEASCKDEARIGNKGRVCHRWWLKGERAPGLVQQGYQWAYIFSAIECVWRACDGIGTMSARHPYPLSGCARASDAPG